MTASDVAQREYDERNLLRMVEDLAKENIFVNRMLDYGKRSNWSTTQTLAQLVVILGRENNRLQDELVKAEYAKAYPDPVVLMDEAKARKILGGWIDEDDDLFCLSEYISFEKGDEHISLDGRFTIEEVEAIAWWLRNKQ